MCVCTYIIFEPAQQLALFIDELIGFLMHIQMQVLNSRKFTCGYSL